MKRFHVHTVAAAALVATVALAPATASAQHKCDGPRNTIEQRACDKAATGADALRRFVERTRGIYALYYWDYARGGAPGGAAAMQSAPLATAAEVTAVVAASAK